MTASAAVSGYGLTFKKASTTIAEVNRISGVGMSRESIEVTHLSSDNEWKEFIVGMLDGGEITIEGSFVPTNATQKAILTDIPAGTSATYTTTTVDGSTFAATMYPLSFIVGDVEPNGRFSFTSTFRTTGAVTYTASA